MVFQVSPKVVVNPLTADRFNICRYPSPSLHHSNNMGFGEQTWMAGKTNIKIYLDQCFTWMSQLLSIQVMTS